MTQYRRQLMAAVQAAGSPYFSIGANKRAQFSPGTLQYHPLNNEWRFSPNQYDIIGVANENISPNYNGWIDLIAWGCSGWSGSGATYYNPTDTNTNGANYYVGGAYSNSLVGAYAEADWAYHNTIGNDAPHTWRTMTQEEWVYLHDRGSQFYASAVINGILGMIVLPDNWVAPAGISMVLGSSDYATNNYTISQWVELEAAGAIFLPMSGIRLGTSVTTVNELSGYWSVTYSTKFKSGYGYMAFNTVLGASRVNGWETGNSSYRSQGFMIRPIKDIIL